MVMMACVARSAEPLPLEELGSQDLNKQKASQLALQTMVYNASRPGAEAERVAICNELAGSLAKDLNPTAKVWIIRQLEFAGRAEAVPALTGALASQDAWIAETARRALQCNPSAEAGAALRLALEKATDAKWRVALINALGYRRDKTDTGVLIPLIKDGNEDVRMAAAQALADIGDKAALAAFKDMPAPSKEAVGRAVEAWLRLAERMADQGEKAAALEMYKPMLNGPGQYRCAAIVGLGRAGDVAELDAIFAAMDDADPKIRGSALEALGLMKSDAVTQAIAAKASNAKPAAKATLLRALAQRGDKSALGVFVAAAEDPDDTVKLEAVRGIAVVGDASALGLLVNIAADGKGQLKDAARMSMDRLPGAGVTSAMIAAMPNAKPAAKAELARSLSARKATDAVDALLKAAADEDLAVRTEAMRALGALGDQQSLSQVLALAAKITDADERDEAVKAIVAICRRNPDAQKRADAVLAALDGAQGPAKALLMNAAGRIGAPAALPTLRGALKSEDAQMRDAAVRALADWPDMGAAADLLAIAKDEAATQTHRVLALQGYLRLVALPSNRNAAQTLNAYREAASAATRPEEKRRIIAGLGDVRHIESLTMIEPYLSDAALREDAAAAAVKVGREIWQGNREAVKPIMQKAAEAARNQRVKQQANEVIDRIDRRR